MRKGSEVDMTVALLIFIAVLSSVIIFLLIHFQRINVDVVNLEASLRSIDASHAAKNCLTENNVIKKSLLIEEKVGKCGIGGYYIRIKDLGSEYMWRYGIYGDGFDHTVFANIESENGVHPAEIYVRT